MGRGSGQEQTLEYRDQIKVTNTLSLPLAEISFRVSRSSGPGGQHANKSETRVEALFEVEASQTLSDAQKLRLLAKAGPVLRAVSQDERSQLRNKERATSRLAELIAAALKTQRKRVPTKTPAAAKERRLDEKRQRAQIKSGRGSGRDRSITLEQW